MLMIPYALILIGTASTTVSAFHPQGTPFKQNSYYSTSSSSIFNLAMATQDTFDFDVAVIGCGVGGHGAALHARSQSLTTAVFSGGDVGGTCVNRGCVPSKALLAASGRVREMKDAAHLNEFGIQVNPESITYSREGIAAHAKNLANRVKGNLENSLKGLGCDVINGRGVLTGKPHEIMDDKTGKIYRAKVRFFFVFSHFFDTLYTDQLFIHHISHCYIYFSLLTFTSLLYYGRTLFWHLVLSHLSHLE